MQGWRLPWTLTRLENRKKELQFVDYSASPRKYLWGHCTKSEALENMWPSQKFSSLIDLETGNCDFNKHLIPTSPAHSGKLLVEYMEKAVKRLQYLSCTGSAVWRQMLSPWRYVNHQSMSESRHFLYPGLDFTPQLSFLKEVIWTIIIMNNGCKHFSAMMGFYL